MHQWFAQTIAEERMAADQQRATAHRVLVAQGRDLASRGTAALLAAAERSAARTRRRRTLATAVLGPAR